MGTLQPEHSARNQPEGTVTGRELVVAGGQGPEVLAAVDRPFHAGAQPVDRAVEGPGPPLRPQPRNRVADAAPATVGPRRSPGVALVADHALGSQPRPAPAGALDRPLRQQRGESGRLVALPRREHQRHRLATPLDPQVDLRRETALAPTERLRLGPPFAPAACWWARTIVLSTKCTSQSSWPAASAARWTAAKIASQIPASRHQRKRVCTLDQGPYRSGRSRQGAPVASFHRMPLITSRSSWRGCPAVCAGSSGCSRAQTASLISCRCIIHLPKLEIVNDFLRTIHAH